MAAHSTWAYPRLNPAVAKAAQIGAYGVDLFFVLSGWLIGSLWFREHIREGHVRPLRFMSRRWLRTLPPYYVAMPIGWLGVYLFRQVPFDFGYLVFIQNYYEKLPFFGVSWSLCIEEHFYLLLPWILVLAMRWRAPVILAAGAMLVMSPIWRWHTWQQMQMGQYNFGRTTTATHIHADGLIIGVIAAAIAAHRPELWKRIKRIARWLAIPAVFLYFSFVFWPWQAQHVIGYTVLPLIWVTLLAAVESSPPVLWADSRVVYWIAISSYSTYLIHSTAMHFAEVLTGRFFSGSWLMLTAIMIPSYVVFCGLFYWFIERTTLQLRDRITGRKPAIEVAGGPV